MKICLVEAELFRAGGRTNRRTDGYDAPNSRLSQFANAPSNMVTSQNIWFYIEPIVGTFMIYMKSYSDKVRNPSTSSLGIC